MAAALIPGPGDPHGPCVVCTHRDCDEHRRRARSICLYCRKPVGTGVLVYYHGDYTVHAACHEDASEKNGAMF